MKKWLKDFMHNCVVHPMLPFLPLKAANWLHDKNATFAFGLERYDELTLECKKKRTICIDAGNIITGAELLKIMDDAKDKKELESWLASRLPDVRIKQSVAFDRRNPEHVKALRAFMESFLDSYDKDGKPMQSVVMFEITSKGQLQSDAVDMVSLEGGAEGFVFNLFLPLQGV